MIRVLLADDHELLRKGVRALLESHPDIEVCGESSNGPGAVDQAVALRPDVAVLDITMPEMNGLDVTKQIRKLAPETEVLIFSAHDSEALVREILGAGARGYILKADAAAHLVAAVEAVSQHDLYFSSGVSGVFVNSFVSDAPAASESSEPKTPLSAREVEITAMLADGKSNKEIAAKLFISVRTVETHRRAILQKLHINSLPELVRYAIRHGITEA
jgi:DNA-binding NarL/FixJ family response regulator